MEYVYKKKTSLPFGEAEEKLRAALAGQGFGILTEIDVKAVMKEKLGIDHPHYKILGACNPSFSHKVLEEEKDIGALLPCNALIYEEADGVVVGVVLPTAQLSLIGNNPQVEDIALAVEEKLKKAVDEV